MSTPRKKKAAPKKRTAPKKKKAPAKKKAQPKKAAKRTTKKAPPKPPEEEAPSSSSGAPIGDTSTGAIRDAVTLALARMSAQGSVPAAGALLKVLREAEEAHAARAHQERLQALTEDPVGLAYYWGELGTDLGELEDRLGREPTLQERQAWALGHRDRALEVRALELAALRSSGGKPPPWTRRKP